MTNEKPPAPTVLDMYCTGGTKMAQSHTSSQPSELRQGRPKNSLLQERTHAKSTGCNCTSQVSCTFPFPFHLSSLLNIYNSSLFQDEARVLSIKTWEGKKCFHEDKFRLTCMASQAFKACLQYTKNSCLLHVGI